jgi:hypothetical protein
MEVEALRLLIWEKLQAGRLPHERISRAQSSPADGQKCDACEKLITMAQFVVTGITLAARGSIQLHVECFQLWDAERCARKS